MKYKFCEQLQKCMFFEAESLIHCCNCSVDEEVKYKTGYFGEKINWKDAVKEKQRLQNEAKQGKIPFSTCKNCHLFIEKEWEETDYINEIVISHWTKCYCNCYYCYTAEEKEEFNSFKEYDLKPILQDMKKDGVLKFPDGKGLVRFLGGDVSELKDFDWYINFFLEAGAKKFYIPTSGIKFLPAVEKVLKEGEAEVIISPDCATRELYKKIKRVDAFETVKNNMKKYAAAARKGKSVFASKYILLPYVNDSKKEIDKWFKLSKDLKIEYLAYDFEDKFLDNYRKNIPPHIVQLLNYIKDEGEKRGFKMLLFRYAAQLFYELEHGIANILTDENIKKEQIAYTEKLLARNS